MGKHFPRRTYIQVDSERFFTDSFSQVITRGATNEDTARGTQKGGIFIPAVLHSKHGYPWSFYKITRRYGLCGNLTEGAVGQVVPPGFLTGVIICFSSGSDFPPDNPPYSAASQIRGAFFCFFAGYR